MIVVDTYVIAYLYLPNKQTATSEKLLELQPEWAAPILWRSEFRNVLALYLRKRMLNFEQAYAIQTEAEELLATREYDVDSLRVLQLSEASGCSAYDCEFIAVAEYLDTALVTADKHLIAAFPSQVLSLEDVADEFSSTP